MLTEGAEIQQMVAGGRLQMAVLAVGAGGGDFTAAAMAQVAERISTVQLEGVGHLAATEDPGAVARALLSFYGAIDA
jgi:protein-L-isoaspartate O-methyltransferase